MVQRPADRINEETGNLLFLKNTGNTQVYHHTAQYTTRYTKTGEK
jgi:hypothetical protein